MKKLLILSLLALTGCANQYDSHEHYLRGKGLTEQTPEKFQHCRGYGCKFISDIEFTAKDWTKIKKAFRPKPRTAKQERRAIKRAIALFEQKTGALAGTHSDHWGTFQKTGLYQHDCVDESTNTTIYLELLQQKGWLTFHHVESPNTRLPLFHAGSWPHQTAVISDIKTGEFFAVDSWFHDNGLPPEIVPLKQWKEGWKPDQKDDSTANP